MSGCRGHTSRSSSLQLPHAGQIAADKLSEPVTRSLESLPHHTTNSTTPMAVAAAATVACRGLPTHLQPLRPSKLLHSSSDPTAAHNSNNSSMALGKAMSAVAATCPCMRRQHLLEPMHTSMNDRHGDHDEHGSLLRSHGVSANQQQQHLPHGQPSVDKRGVVVPGSQAFPSQSQLLQPLTKRPIPPPRDFRQDSPPAGMHRTSASSHQLGPGAKVDTSSTKGSCVKLPAIDHDPRVR